MNLHTYYIYLLHKTVEPWNIFHTIAHYGLFTDLLRFYAFFLWKLVKPTGVDLNDFLPYTQASDDILMTGNVVEEDQIPIWFFISFSWLLMIFHFLNGE